jgi:hypothetical protein
VVEADLTPSCGSVIIQKQQNKKTAPSLQPTDLFYEKKKLGCISLGAAYTYYQKKQGEKAIDGTSVVASAEAAQKPKEEHLTSEPKTSSKPEANKEATAKSKNVNYQQVYNDIAELLDSDPE